MENIYPLDASDIVAEMVRGIQRNNYLKAMMMREKYQILYSDNPDHAYKYSQSEVEHIIAKVEIEYFKRYGN